MTDEELIARLRDTADHARFEPHLHHTAADLIEEYGRAYTHLLREFDKRGDRIEALVKANRELVMQGLADSGQAQEAYEAQLKAEARATRAYSERTAAAVAMARLATMAGFKAGIGQDSNEAWDAEWRVVLYVDTPAGQVSWHIAPHDQHLLADLPQYDGEWDGTYRSRDGSFSNWSAMQTNAEAERDAANALLREARIDLEVYITNDYPKDKHPYYERKWNHEMDLCHRIDAHLGAKP